MLRAIRIFAWALCCAFFLYAAPSFSYVLQLSRNSRGQIVSIRWPASQARNGIDFWIDMPSFRVLFLERHILPLVREGFAAWEAVETSFIAFRDRGTGNFDLSTEDGRNVVTFDRGGEHFDTPRGTGVIAFTRIDWDDAGQIIDADIVFNGRDFRYSVGQPAPGGGLVDMRGVLIHEIGHLLGLDHSGLAGDVAVRPTMYPFYFGGERSLEADDRAGVSALYPSPDALNAGTIAGRVTDRDGQGMLGVHVVAYRAGTDTFVVGALSGAAGERPGRGGDGAYEITGLPPGDYHVAIEALDGPVTAANFGGVFDRFETGFPREFYDNSATQAAAVTLRLGPARRVDGIDFVLGTALPGFPYIRDAALPSNTPDPAGPYRVQARITDEDGIASAEMVYRVNGGPVQTLPLRPGAGQVFSVDLPGQARGTVVEYRLRARDGAGNTSVFPAEELPMLRFEVLSLSGQPVLYVALRRSRALAVFDTGQEREVARIPTGDTPLSVALTPDERYLFVANNGEDESGSENRLTVVETATHKTQTIQVGSEPLDMTISRNGARLYVTNANAQSISVVDLGSLREVQRLSVPIQGSTGRGPFGIAVSPDDRRLYVTDIDADQVVILDLGTGRVTHRIDVVASPRTLVVSPSGDRLYAAGFDGGISVIDTEANRVATTLSTGTASVFRLALSPDGKRLYATDRVNSSVLVVDLAQNRIAATWPAQGRETRDLAISEDGRTLYVANQDSDELLIFDTATGRVLNTFTLANGPRGIAVKRLPVYKEPPLADAQLADFNGDGRVNFSDFVLFARAFGTGPDDALFDPAFDLNGDRQVGFSDFVLFAGAYGWVAG